jgi:hypothetical protein
MGFRIRKSFKLFPGVKINVSKKGLGVSAGVKGFTVNSRGNLNIGTGPVTYQTNLNTKNNRTKSNKSSIIKIVLLCIIFFVVIAIFKRV